MKLNDLMEIIHRSYPDELTRECWDPDEQQAHGGTGDTLAEFIVREIADTYDQALSTEAQLAEAVRAMNRAAGDIGGVASALETYSNPTAMRGHANAYAKAG